ncbi:MAG: sensor histidine kinase [Planctomycetota bacterium]|jgi:signal transduction histidine kinase
MNEELHRSLREEDLAFFGRIGADVSHEMRNVLSIIGQYAGLLDDLLALAKGRKLKDYAKLQEIPAKIAGQVRKGTEAMERFSRFAHATDERTASFDLTALTGNLAALAQRHVTRAGCRLEAKLPDEAIPVRANSFSLQRAVFSAIELILEFLERGEPVTMKLVTQGPTAVISLSGSAAGGGELSGRISRLSAVMNELKGGVETSSAGGALSLNLTVPIQ